MQAGGGFRETPTDRPVCSSPEGVMIRERSGTSASVMINAPVERVWEALTVPEQIKRWFFGVDTESDWKAGSALVHRGEWKGKPYVDKGEILGDRGPDPPRPYALERYLGPP